MKTFAALFLIASIANAETWMMTNGVPVSGTVVSSQVAAVWIRTPLGAVRQIPVEAFDEESCTRLPRDAAGIYVACDTWARAADKAANALNKGASALKKVMNTESALTDLNERFDSIGRRQQVLFAELQAWRDANMVADATPEQRQAFVDEQVSKARAALSDAHEVATVEDEPAPAPAVEPPSPSVRSATAKVTNRPFDGFVEVSWKTEIYNPAKVPVKGSVRFRFLDGKGFPVAEGFSSSDVLLKPGVTSVSELQPMQESVWKQVKRYEALID